MEICNLCECTCWNSWVIARVVDTEEEEIYHMACLSTFTDRSGSIFSEKKKRGKKWEVSFHYRFCLEELQSILQQYQQHIHIQQETIMEVVPPTKVIFANYSLFIHPFSCSCLHQDLKSNLQQWRFLQQQRQFLQEYIFFIHPFVATLIRNQHSGRCFRIHDDGDVGSCI